MAIYKIIQSYFLELQIILYKGSKIFLQILYTDSRINEVVSLKYALQNYDFMQNNSAQNDGSSLVLSRVLYVLYWHMCGPVASTCRGHTPLRPRLQPLSYDLKKCVNTMVFIASRYNQNISWISIGNPVSRHSVSIFPSNFQNVQ